MIRLRALAARVVRHLWPGAKRRTLCVQTDLANFCNLRCRMCYFFAGQPEEKIRINFDEFRRRFDPFADRIQTFGLSCATEPLVVRDEDLMGVLGWLRRRRIPDSFMVTNAVLLRPKIAEEIVASGLTRLVVSLDSHDKEVFESIRIGASFDTVIRNVRHFTAYRRSQGLSKPELHVNCVLMRRNIEGVGAFVDFVHELGADAIDFRHMVPYAGLGIDEESLVHHKQLCNAHLRIARDRCKKLGLRVVAIPAEFGPATDAPRPAAPTKVVCKVPSTFLYVRHDGSIQPCVFWFGEDPVGNLASGDFESVWNAPLYAALRDETARGVFTRRCCRTCPSLGGGSVDNESSFGEREK